MRKSLIAILAVASSAALYGCEDGPNQTYSPAPDGAAARWNDGKNVGTNDNGAKQGFVADTNAGANAQELCSGPKRAARWAKMVLQDIVPPGRAAGIDGFGNTDTEQNWPGVTIAEAEKINCQSEPSGNTFGDGDIVNQWGDAGEVWVKYNPNTQKVDWFVLNNGYQGKMTFHSRDGADTFVLGLGTKITKNGQPFAIDWSKTSPMPGVTPVQYSPDSLPYMQTELADALFATFSPELEAEDIPGGSCNRSGRCVPTNFTDQGALRIYPLGIHIWVDNPNAMDATPYTPVRLDIRLPRIEPYTYAYTQLKLDAEGPIAIAKGVGPVQADGSHSDCKLQLGTSWGDFIANCIKTTGDPSKDATFFNKLVGSIQHDDERYTFNVTGVDVNATSRSLDSMSVLHDADRPADVDEITSLYVDGSTLGVIANDAVLGDDNLPVLNAAGKTKKDLHGAGRVYLEYGRLVQTEINKVLAASGVDPKELHQLGDPACLGSPAKGQSTTYCTGFEGIVTAAPPPADTKAKDYGNRLGPDAAGAYDGSLALGLKPGKPQILFCNDETGIVDVIDDCTDPKSTTHPGIAQDCNGNPTAYQSCTGGNLFQASFDQVTATLGGGDVTRLPSEFRDRRFFFKQYVTALVKLFKATKAVGTLPDTLENVQLNANDFFFDAQGSGQYERGEYVDRATEDPQQGLTDIEIVCDILNGTMYSYQFFRGLYRGESAIYKAITEDASNLDVPGKEESGLTTNIYGSPVLAAMYTDHAAMDANMNPLTPRSAYYCASTGWTTQAELDAVTAECEGNIAPTDPNYVPDPLNKKALPVMPLMENGGPTGSLVPILQPYPGAFHDGPFHLPSTSLKIIAQNETDKTAVLQIPIPIDGSTETVVVPSFPPRPGFGWPYPLTGTRDLIVPTGLMDFAGTTLTGNLFYTQSPELDADKNPTGNLIATITAVESNDYLGDIFLCSEGGTFLKAKMYDPVLPMLEWLDAHPAAYNDCGIIVRYSVFNNYPDFIISQSNGVILSTTQGAGFGRVNNVTLFAPGNYQ